MSVRNLGRTESPRPRHCFNRPLCGGMMVIPMRGEGVHGPCREKRGAIARAGTQRKKESLPSPARAAVFRTVLLPHFRVTGFLRRMSGRITVGEAARRNAIINRTEAVCAQAR